MTTAEQSRVEKIKKDINEKKLPTIQFGIEPDSSQNDYVYTVYPGGVDTEEKVGQAAQAIWTICVSKLQIFAAVQASVSSRSQRSSPTKLSSMASPICGRLSCQAHRRESI